MRTAVVVVDEARPRIRFTRHGLEGVRERAGEVGDATRVEEAARGQDGQRRHDNADVCSPVSVDDGAHLQKQQRRQQKQQQA